MLKITVLTSRLLPEEEYDNYLQKLAQAGYPEDVVDTIKQEGKALWSEDTVETHVMVEQLPAPTIVKK